MKKESYILDAQDSEQALTMIKSYLKPRELNHLTVGKEKIGGETCCAVTFGMFLDEKEYKRLKAYAQAADAIGNANTEFYEENPDAETTPEHVELPENVKDFLEHQRAIWFAIANNEDCEK